MQAFVNYVKEYWVLFVLLAVALVALFFMTAKASSAVTKSKKEKEMLIKQLDRIKMLRENYSHLTEEKILSDSGENLLDGIRESIQSKIEKDEDMASSFEALRDEEKLVYAFSYFLEEAETAPSEFFRNYTRPLTPCAVKACGIFLGKEAARAIEKEYNSFDEENENTSFIEEEIEKLDEKIKSELDIASAKSAGADFIKKNVSQFI